MVSEAGPEAEHQASPDLYYDYDDAAVSLTVFFGLSSSRELRRRHGLALSVVCGSVAQDPVDLLLTSGDFDWEAECEVYAVSA